MHVNLFQPCVYQNPTVNMASAAIAVKSVEGRRFVPTGNRSVIAKNAVARVYAPMANISMDARSAGDQLFGKKILFFFLFPLLSLLVVCYHHVVVVLLLRFVVESKTRDSDIIFDGPLLRVHTYVVGMFQPEKPLHEHIVILLFLIC